MPCRLRVTTLPSSARARKAIRAGLECRPRGTRLWSVPGELLRARPGGVRFLSLDRWLFATRRWGGGLSRA
jgi:hypothetical protein